MYRKKSIIAGIAIVILLFGIVLLIALYQSQPGQQQKANQQDMSGVVGRKRQAIENQFPEFKDYEKQQSFAGTAVTSEVSSDGTTHYFAYLLMGSGLPIAKASCFQVDNSLQVIKIGEFPDMTDSYAGYPTVDPKTCKGVK